MSISLYCKLEKKSLLNRVCEAIIDLSCLMNGKVGKRLVAYEWNCFSS